MTRTTLETYERAGLAALVRAGEAKEWFHGHIGAALIAGARLLGEPDLPGPAGLALSQRLEAMFANRRDWVRPLEEQGESVCGPEPLLERLRSDAGVLRSSGHSTIYGAIALDVLARHPSLATPRVIDGLVGLHSAGREDDPRRYYGIANYFEWIEREAAAVESSREALRAPRQDTSIDTFRRALDSFAHLVADRDLDGRRYFLTGEKIHLVTHAHAIATFERLGHLDIAHQALWAQRCLEGLVAPSDGLEATRVDRAETTPYHAAFWEEPGVDPDHVIKLAEAFVAEIRRLPEDEKRSRLHEMGWMWPMLGIA
jgi:hypothetical protein